MGNSVLTLIYRSGKLKKEYDALMIEKAELGRSIDRKQQKIKKLLGDIKTLYQVELIGVRFFTIIEIIFKLFLKMCRIIFLPKCTLLYYFTFCNARLFSFYAPIRHCSMFYYYQTYILHLSPPDDKNSSVGEC